MPGLHIVLTTYLRQPPLPSHLPSVPQVATGIVVQMVESRGASPDERFTHVPTAVGAEAAAALGVARARGPDALGRVARGTCRDVRSAVARVAGKGVRAGFDV